ncbi:hypothetical protein PR048_016236 [Dryococelus australis]|uniref:Uncharacterized protein n=1 Tax=Dryococelus australis TaxID=614101 RepID=A0ABQ9HJK5_9NEOP|nr:hypothetical protein PR048_016236 [Dryococelus australis]
MKALKLIVSPAEERMIVKIFVIATESLGSILGDGFRIVFLRNVSGVKLFILCRNTLTVNDVIKTVFVLPNYVCKQEGNEYPSAKIQVSHRPRSDVPTPRMEDLKSTKMLHPTLLEIMRETSISLLEHPCPDYGIIVYERSNVLEK